MKKRIFVTLLWTLFVWSIFAADNVKTVNLEYELNNTTGKLITKDKFDFSIDNYLYFKLKDNKIFKNLKNFRINLKDNNDNNSIAFVCVEDQDVMDIDFQKYKDKVEKLQDENKKKACETEFVFAVTWNNQNTYVYQPWDTFITLDYENKPENNNSPFEKFEMRDADNNVVISFNIEKKQEQQVQQPVEQKQEQKEEKEQQNEKIVNTKKTWLSEILFSILMLLSVLSVIIIRKRIIE